MYSMNCENFSVIELNKNKRNFLLAGIRESLSTYICTCLCVLARVCDVMFYPCSSPAPKAAPIAQMTSMEVLKYEKVLLDQQVGTDSVFCR